MPVSPRDFELYSRMTGASMPNDAASRARMAPDVYDFTRNFAKNPNILDKAGDMVKGIGRTFQRGIGAGIQADLSEAKTPYRPTSQNLGQRVSENQTNVGLEERKGTQAMEVTSGPSTVAEEISGSQSSNPDMTSIDRDVKREVQAVAGSVPLTTKEMLQGGGSDNMFTRNLGRTITGDGMKEIGGTQEISEIDGGKEKLAEFTRKTGLIPGLTDPSLVSAVEQSGQPEEKFGYKGYLTSFDDHTQMEGGEDNIGARSQVFAKEVEEVQVDPSPNRSKDVVSERATNQMLQQIEKNKQDEARIKGLNLNFGSKETTPEQEENFKKLGAAQELQKTFPNTQSLSILDPLGALNDPDFMQSVRKGQNQESQSTTNDVDNFVNLIEGSRTDLFPGRFKGKSMGVSYVPPTNGDGQVTFNYTNVPVNPKPETGVYGDATSVQTGTFGVDEGGMDYLQNQMSPDTFGSYYNRAKREAKEGKKRQAGEIFGFVSEGDRVIPDQFSL